MAVLPSGRAWSACDVGNTAQPKTQLELRQTLPETLRLLSLLYPSVLPLVSRFILWAPEKGQCPKYAAQCKEPELPSRWKFHKELTRQRCSKQDFQDIRGSLGDQVSSILCKDKVDHLNIYCTTNPIYVK